VDVLHLTDLHVTEPNTSLESVWTTAADVLRGAKRTEFDFIVISGDLTQAAKPKEYKQLRKFTDTELVPRLRKQERNRIIFVPGNHDVTWSHPTALRPVKPQSLASGVLEQFLREPHKSEIRARITKTGGVDVRRRDPANYGQRLAEVQKFLDAFYRPSPPKRGFRLTSDHPRDHFSAHVFRDEGIAFYGFNSCFYNDEVWRGATLEEETVTAAVGHARTHADGLLWVAVWHHGLASDRGNPDHLIARDLGFLRFNGFHVGMHGHTHVDEFGDLRDILGERFPVIATGSFAAGTSERPEGALNQFAVLELGRSYLYVDRYERRPTTQWARKRLPPYLLLRDGESSEGRFNDAEHHTCSVELDLKTGFADVKVKFEHIAVEQELVLAEPSGPFSNLIYEYKARADGALIDVFDAADIDGRKRIKFGGRGRFDELVWSCKVSNVLACNLADLKMRSRSPFVERMCSIGGTEYDWFGQHVRVHTRSLTLQIDVKASTARSQPLFAPNQVIVRVLDANLDDATGHVQLSPPEVSPDGNHVHATISRPVIGYRYLLGYRPQLTSAWYPPAVLTLMSDIADALRVGLPDDVPRRTLTERVGHGLRIAIACKPEQNIVWYGYLWNHRRERLETAFGNCPWLSAGSEFEYGKGVIGHAFRTCEPASYFKADGASSLILTGQTPFDWIVALPIRMLPDGPAVGVVGFAGREPEEWSRDLRDYAQRAADLRRLEQRLGALEPVGQEQAPPDVTTGIEDRLVQSASITFWYALQHVVMGLGEADRAEYRKIFSIWHTLVSKTMNAAPE